MIKITDVRAVWRKKDKRKDRNTYIFYHKNLLLVIRIGKNICRFTILFNI